mgnify:CR=1 FL=1
MVKPRGGRRVLAAVCLLFMLLLTACGEQTTVPYAVPDNLEHAASGTVAQNARYTLEWDDVQGCVLLRERDTGYVWSTIPYEFYQTGEYNVDLLSQVRIEYYDMSNASIQEAYGYDCVEMGNFSSVVDGNSVRVTYYFEEAAINLTIVYTLREDSLEVSFNSDDIEELGSMRLISVSLTPYMTAAPNVEDRNYYLFVPAGSGALMYTDNDPSGLSRDYSGEVYGTDMSRYVLNNSGDEEAVRLPAFGVKKGENALCAIIEGGEGSALVEATAGAERDGYSAVYSTFYVRGFANIEWDTGTTHNGVEIFQDTVLLQEERLEDKTFSIGYYPLTGENADYSGMAALYRQYLQEAGLLEKSTQEQQPYHVTLIGGAQAREFTLGIPHTALLPLTTFEQSQQIVEELRELTGYTPEVLLKGFGASGMDVGKVAGGFTFAGELGSKASQSALESFCQEQGIPLFTDFDVVRFNQSGNGFNPLFSSATAASTDNVTYYPLKRNVRAEDTDKSPIYLLEHASLNKAIEKLRDFTQDRVSGIALTTFGSMPYSDHQELQSTLRNDIEEQMRETLTSLREDGHSILLGAANAYAAGLADSVYDVPLQNGNYQAFDETVPFYQMVFRGTVPLYSTAVNLSPDAEGMLLRAVEAGVSPSYTLSYSLYEALADSDESMYYGILYESNKQRIADDIARTQAFFEEVADAGIQRHTIVQDGLTRTEFDNGVVVLVNHSDEDILVDGTTIAAHSFVY